MRNKQRFENALPYIVSLSLHLALGFGMVIWGRQFIQNTPFPETNNSSAFGENAIHIVRLNEVAIRKSKPSAEAPSRTSVGISHSTAPGNSYFSRIATQLVSEPFNVSEADLKITLFIRFQLLESTSTKNTAPAKVFYLISVQTIFDSHAPQREANESDPQAKSTLELSQSLKDQVVSRLQQLAESEGMELQLSRDETPVSTLKNSPVFELPIRL